MVQEGLAVPLFHHHHLDLPLLPLRAHPDVVAVPVEDEVEPGVSDCQVADRYVAQALGEPGLAEVDAAGGGVDVQAQAGGEEEEDGSRGGGLGRAGRRVEGGPLARAAISPPTRRPWYLPQWVSFAAPPTSPTA